MTSIVPVDVSEVTRAVQAMLQDAPDVGGTGVSVERAAPPTEEVGAHGWLSIYRTAVRYPPRTLGMGTGYRTQAVELVIIAQENDPTSGEECEERLENLLKRTIGVLLSDPSLKGTVDTLDEFDVVYEQDKTKSDMYFQRAWIRFTGLVKVSAI